MSAATNSLAQPDRRGGRARATREALVELAADLFAEQGYVQTSIRDITRRGALTTGAMYGHFRNKADLLAEAIRVRTAEQLEAQSVGLGEALDYVETLTRLARQYPKRRQLRALIVQGASAAQTDEETRARLRQEQLSYLNSWLNDYQRERDRLGIHPEVDMQAALLYTWAAELGLGVLEGIGITPRSRAGWADVQNRVARSLQLPPDELERRPPRRPSRARSRAQAKSNSRYADRNP